MWATGGRKPLLLALAASCLVLAVFQNAVIPRGETVVLDAASDQQSTISTEDLLKQVDLCLPAVTIAAESSPPYCPAFVLRNACMLFIQRSGSMDSRLSVLMRLLIASL